MYEKLTNAKSNFDSNQILSKIWLYIYIYIYILPRFIYIGLFFFYIELTHLIQKLEKFRLDGTRGVKLNFN